jgi:hypothetical protein
VGLSGLSKYQALPLIAGLVLVALCLRGVKQFASDVLFWSVAFVVALCVVSPVLIWNVHNHFASFLFQGQHGFSEFHVSVRPLLRYLLGALFYLWPWFFVPLFLFACRVSFSFLQKKRSFHKSFLLVTLPFLILFFLILYSALGKQALPHWAMPGFFLLLPAFVLVWDPFGGVRKDVWKKVFLVSFGLSTLLPLLCSISAFRQGVLQGFVAWRGDASPLAQALQWESLPRDLLLQKGVNLGRTGQNLPCSEPVLASLNWYWTAQLAFHIPGTPQVLNLDTTKTSFYPWRDVLPAYAGCPVLVLGSLDHFNATRLGELISLESQETFSLPPYSRVTMVLVRGHFKNAQALSQAQAQLTSQIRY